MIAFTSDFNHDRTGQAVKCTLLFLFNGASSTYGLYSAEQQDDFEWWNGNDLERSSPGLFQGTYNSMCLKKK